MIRLTSRACAVILGLGLAVACHQAPPTIAQLRESIDQGSLERAESGCRDLLEAMTARGQHDGAAYADVLDLLVETLWRNGRARTAEAASLARQALDLKQAELGPDDARLATSLDNLGHIERLRGQQEQAEELFRKGLAIREGSLGPDHPDVGHSLNQLCWVVNSRGDLDAARALCLRSVSIRERALGEHPDLASSLNNLAIVEKTLGAYDSAKALYERSRSIYETTFGPDHSQTASAINNLAALADTQGDYAAALPLYEQAIQAARNSSGDDHPLTATALGNLAALFAKMGDLSSSERLHREALRILEARFGSTDPQLAATLNSLGAIQLERGRPDEAGPFLTRALEIRETALGADHLLVSRVLNNLGLMFIERQEPERARQSFRRSLAIVEAKVGAQHADTANVLHKLGELEQHAGDLVAAREYLERSHAAYEALLGQGSPATIRSMVSLATLLYDADQRAEATSLALRADRVGREHLQLTVRILPERQALGYAAYRPAAQGVVLSAVNDGRAGSARVRAGWDAVVRSRAIVFEEMRLRQQVRRSSGSAADELEQATERYVNLLLAAPTEFTEQHRQLLEQARQQKDRAERKLAQDSLPLLQQRESADVGLDDVLASLPVSTSLVAYVRYPHRRESQSIPSYTALVANRGKVSALYLGDAETIDGLVSDWRNDILEVQNRVSLLGQSQLDSYSTHARALREAIWDPVLDRLAGSREIMVVADGSLHLVNIDTLVNDDGSYVIEESPPILQLSTERDVVGLRSGRAAGRGLLALGGVEFGASAVERNVECADLGSLVFPALPATLREARAIESIWAASGNERVTTLGGLEATEEALSGSARGHEVLHIATHGFVVTESCSPDGRSATGASLVDRLALSRPDGVRVIAGIALANANKRPRTESDESNGILTADEIATMDLEGVDWVVLSGCDTALGPIQAGEGMFGLRRAFQIAGARTLITSLWAVEDSSTRAWMQRLYENRLKADGATQAVRNASLETLRQRRRDGQSTHPFYWGAFVAFGN